jgi:Xaa-Pro dipeptidase
MSDSLKIGSKMAALSLLECAARRNRLREYLSRANLEVAIVTDPRDIYYFSGLLLPNDLPGALVLSAGGQAYAVTPEGYTVESVERVVAYEWNHRGTRHPDVNERAAKGLKDLIASCSQQRVAVQTRDLRIGQFLAFEAAALSAAASLDDAIAELQKRKDADEIDVIRASIHANLGAYEAARRAIRPGISELDVLAAGYRGAMEAAGEKVFHDGDYQCGQYNGPARNRRIKAGELYIIDAWTCYRGYWSDMSRTFMVGQPPTDVQRELYDHIRKVQQEVPKLLKPGVDGREVYRALDEMIREHPRLVDEGLIHHGGHAIGLRIHEMPDINLARGGVLESGNVICIEPGGYFAEARFGVRLENMYLVTADGCEDLCPGEVELHIYG